LASNWKANVVVVDAEPLARLGLVQLINSHSTLRVCAEADSAPLARQAWSQHKLDLVVLDLAISGGEGFALLKELPRWHPDARVVVCTRFDDAISVHRAFKAGACGYVTRRDPADEVIAAIVAALKGERHIGGSVRDLIIDQFARSEVDHPEKALSPRELQVYRLLGYGGSARKIATQLHLDFKTIETHLMRVRKKLNVSTLAELRRRAILFVTMQESNGASGGRRNGSPNAPRIGRNSVRKRDQAAKPKRRRSKRPRRGTGGEE
jgi:DNA-binding NarL/FixJ family response regulator